MGGGPGAATLVLATIFLWGVFSAQAQRADLSAPIVFVVAGLLYAEGLDVLDLELGSETIRLLAEVTLVWVLFSDASGVRLHALRTDLGTYVRLLGIGLPLTIGLGLLAAVLLLDMDAWTALLLGAALAPTDAALGSAVVADPAVPARIRRLLNVESGLNDGIVTPVVLLAISEIAANEGIAGVEEPGRASVSLVAGAAVGVLLGGAGGRLTRLARGRGWLSEDWAGPAVLALALLAYSGAVLVDANGFVAAFVGGLAFGATEGREREQEVSFVEQSGRLASLMSWLVFGAVLLPVLTDHVDWRVVVYALLSLTVVRMLPVALALVGTGLDPASVAFVGWFGPRGLASVIFALLAIEGLHGAAADAVATIALTVLLSVAAHGVTATPLAKRYGRSRRSG
jgi:NhaP-type Na+/H+ or K+/H+ antiporter